MILNVNLTGIDAVRSQFAKLGKAPQQALAVTAEKVEDYIQSQIGTHAKTGALERSLSKKRIPGGWEIGHDSRVAPYARFVHDGTRPHVIFPKGASLTTQRELFGINGTQRGRTADGKLKAMPGGRKLVLRWAMGGRFIYAQYVNHPGNKPDKWMDRAAALAPNIFRAALEAQLSQRT